MEKAEEVIAPLLDQEVDGRPDILIEFGNGHSDIVPYLRHPGVRDTALGFHERLGDYIDPSFDEEYLEKMAEFRFDEGCNSRLYIDPENRSQHTYDKNYYEWDSDQLPLED